MKENYKMRFNSWRKLQSLLSSGLRNDTEMRMKTSAMVFAPHPDDETLGCGGTIILKRQAGTPVTCVFMTDGSASHRQYMQADQLSALRKSEAINAADVLGLSPEEVHFLNYPDGELKRFHRDAVIKITGLLNRYNPYEVYVPYRTDGLADHETTYKVVVDALDKSGLTVQICEYPIWLWNQWPWVSLHIRFNSELFSTLLGLIRSGFGLRLIRECRSVVSIGNLLEIKRRALAEHRSQMTSQIHGTAWPTLNDVSDGEFLKCFFQEVELFRCSHINGKNYGVSKIN